MSGGSVTRKRDLRTGRPLWQPSTASLPPAHPLAADLTVEAAVIGAGVSGACVAARLARAGREVAIVDRRPPASGSTAASTALVIYELDQPLVALARSLGLGAARRAWLRSFESLGALRQIVDEEGIACEWGDRASLLVTGNKFGWRALRAEADARQRAGMDAAFLSRRELIDQFGVDRTGAVLSHGSAVADPVRLTAGLLSAAAHRGARLYSPVEIREVVPERGRVRLHTDSGHDIVARQVVFCTGYELLRGVSARGHRLDATWAIATAAKASYPAWLDTTVVWEASEPYLYLRTTADRRLVAGGEDEARELRHRDRRLLGRKARAINQKLGTLIPDLHYRIQYRWAGTFGGSDTGLPMIGAVPGMAGCYAVMGFGGNGIVNASIASELIVAALEGRRDPDARLYRLSS